ncbi:jg13962 [Pararge aegeria aegeria]|uniref:Jg13962 protein n=1 Tax=Pararge aegeria aegeria TaxID=348720 RepID=A0A8S4QU07_9NEOP|nr:jg13962 [Pararge aegeria aegeria]
MYYDLHLCISVDRVCQVVSSGKWLKYNQSEGLVIDKKVGPPGRWKWHALNEPPVLRPVYLDTNITEDPCLRNFVEETNVAKKPNQQMIAIEHEKFLKERATKKFQNYKPFEIRMKALKMNESFSLRIVKQSKINLLFRYGRNHLRQNIGMALKCDKIIDTEIIEIDDVPTPYDRQIPKSESIAAIQNVLLKAKRVKH